MNLGLSLLFGAIVGLSLGLTGGGGAIFAVPLLVYGLQVPPRDAISISLAAVGATATIGFVRRWQSGGVEVPTGLLFAIAGMLGAPIGTWLASRIPEQLLLLLFGCLMLAVATRMWMGASRNDPIDAVDGSKQGAENASTCRRDESGRLLLNTPCAILLALVGVGTGILSGMFGVGGGFIIVPALLFFSGMSMHLAVGTSLLVVALVSGSGVVSQWVAGRSLTLDVTLPFIAGGIIGLFAGQSIASRIQARTLQRVFSIAILGVAALVIARTAMKW